MTLGDLERWDVRAQIFPAISVITLVPFDLQNEQIRQGIKWGRRHPRPLGAGLQLASPIFWNPYAHTDDAEQPNFA